MKKYLPWHHTPIGSVVLWLGSIELAVPILALTAVGLAVGTYLDSTRGSAAARHAVYGSWWFIAVMILVCVSLVFAVMSRYPWKRRHVGFITVHAGLIGLIGGGFVSLFGRVEGHLPLEEGNASNVMETQDEVLELVEHNAGQFATVGSAESPRASQKLTLGGIRIQVLERWDNCREEEIVNDDAPMPFRAVQIAAGEGMMPTWVGEEGKAGPAPVIGGLLVRVLPDGGTWEPPTVAAARGYVFSFGGHSHALAEEGQEALPGWKISSIKKYRRAMVGSDGLIELSSGPENPAVDVTISDGKGSVERHTAFLNFPDMVMSRTVSGAVQSGAKLTPGANANPETVVVFGTIAAPRVAYIAPSGESRVVDESSSFPKNIEVGQRRIVIAKQFARARGGWQTLKAPPGGENRPAVVVRIGDSSELTTIPFKGMSPVPGSTRPMMARFGPKMVTLPFGIKLTEFRKQDYPGTEMAMAYESDVQIAFAGSSPVDYRIFMNHPYKHGPWKVYQSGFVGEAVSIFSIMRDPGLPLTYISSIVLCVGIMITFFSRSLSWGHPGIPAGIIIKESGDASPSAATPAVVASQRPIGAGSV